MQTIITTMIALLMLGAPTLRAQDLPAGLPPLPTAGAEALEQVLNDPPPIVGNDVDWYFNTDSLVPEGQQVRRTGVPKQVNTKRQPASQFVFVDKAFSSESAQARLVAADRALKLGRYDAALQIYDDILVKQPDNDEVMLGRAIALQNLDRYDEAMAAYETLIEFAPHNIDAKINMLGLISERYPAVALQRLEELRKKHNDHIPLIGQIAIVQARVGHYKEALQTLGIIASMQPQSAEHIFNMAVIADHAGMIKQAVEYYEQALDLDTIYAGSRSVPREQIFDRLANLR